MNGVHCQTSTVTIDASGWSEMNATELKPRKFEHLVEDPEERREHLLLPDQRRHDRHQQERRDQQRAHEPLPEELPVEQDREQRPEERATGRRRGRSSCTLVHIAWRKNGSLKICLVVVDPDELRRLGDQRLRLVLQVGEAVVDADEERQLRDRDREEQRREQRQPPTPRGGERISDPSPAAWRRRLSRASCYLIACDAICWHWLERVGVLRRAGDHAREELGAPVADILELRDADVLHTR